MLTNNEELLYNIKVAFVNVIKGEKDRLGKIELLRKKLNRLVEKEDNLTSAAILELSQELDKELNKYINERIKKSID